MEDADWTRLVAQLRRGDCTPFLGAGACAGTLPTGAELSRSWAAEYGYPFPDTGELARVMQWAVLAMGDAVYVKERLAESLKATPPPDFDDREEPHRLLADLPLRLYLTTNYDDFMTHALEHAGRRPQRATCPWYQGAIPDPDDPPAGAVLDFPEPVVYHLHGSFGEPGSMVLTEDDYLEFLLGLGMDKGADRKQFLPPYVLGALTSNPMLFIGYSLRDWTFQVLFRGLLRTMSPVQHRRHISVQLSPLPATTDSAVRAEAERYLTQYLNSQLNVSVYWGTVREFCHELRQRLDQAGPTGGPSQDPRP